MSAHLTSKRRGLRIGTALATGIIGIMQVPAAQAQTLPTIGTGNNGGAVITTIQTVNPNDTRQVDINGASRDINWQTYSIGTGGFVNYVNTGAAGNYVALNRVTGGNLSQIDGTINAPSSITVWLINPSGIMFSNGSTFSGGSLVLSTLPAANAGEINDILSNSGTIVLGDSTGNANAASLYPGTITVQPTSVLTSSGRVELISQQITVNGTIDATGNVGLVLGHGVSIDAAAASPLRYTIDAGARLTGRKLTVGGSISGANVELVAVTRDAVTGALLQVDDAAVITAEAVDGSIYLYAEATATGDSANLVVDGDLVASNATNTTGKIDIFADDNVTLSGNISIEDAGGLEVDGDIITLGGTNATTFDIGGNARFTSVQGENIIAGADLTLIAGGNVDFVSDGDALIDSAISAGGNLAISGDSVVLGNGTDSRLLEAAGTVDVSTSVGNLTIETDTSLVSTGSTLALTASSGDVIVRGNAQSGTDLTVTASNDVRLAEYDSANENGLLRANGGDVLIDAGQSVIGDGGTSGAMPTALRGIYGYDVTGDLTVNVAGDLTVTGLKAGGDLALTIGGALAGVADGALPALQSGAVHSTTGSVTIKANANGSSVVLNEVQAATAIEIWADDVAIGTLNQGAATLALKENNGSGDLLAGAPSNYYFGLLTKTGDLTVTNGHSGVATTVVAIDGTDVFDPDFGKADLTATGSISGTIGDGAQLGAVSAGTTINLGASGLLADSSSAVGTTTYNVDTGTLAIGTVQSGDALSLIKLNGSTGTDGDELRLGTGTVTAGGATLSSKTSTRVGSLTATSGNVFVDAADGDVSGLLSNGGTDGALALISTGSTLDSDYGSADLTSGDGSVTVEALNGAAQLGDVSSDTDFTVTAKALSLNNAGVGGAATLDATEGTLVLTSLTGGLQANATKAGGSIATAGDDLRILTSFSGGTSGLSTGTTVNSSTHVRAGTVQDYTGTVDVNASAGDIVINHQVRAVQSILLDAGRDVQIAAYNSTTNDGRIWSQLGGIDIIADRSVYGIGGSATALPVTPGVGSDYVVNGDILVQGVGNVLVGSITASGTISFDLTGGFYGTTGTSGSDVEAGALFAAGDINVTALGGSIANPFTDGVNVLNRANSTGGDVYLSGEKIAIGTPDVSQTFYFDQDGNARTLPDANVYVGVIEVTGPYVLAPNDFTAYSNLIATEDTSGLPAYGTEKFEALLGNANLSAGGTITGTITGAAQLGSVVSGDLINLTVGALVANGIDVGFDSLEITATTGTLSILDASVSGSMTLIKQGGSVLTAGDDLRVLTASTGGSIDLTSSTSIRVGSLNASGAAINLTATNGDISGMRTGTWGTLPTTSSTSVLSTDFDQADLVSAGTITVTANNGAIQLGNAEATGAITADAKAFVADTLTAHGLTGLIDVAVTSGSLNVGTTTADSTTTLIKTGANGAIRFDTITGPGVTLDSATDVIGTTITTTGALVDIDALNDISVDTINAGSVDALAQRDGDFQTVTSTGSAYLGAVRDLTVDSLTSTTSGVITESGRNLTVTTKIDGKTSASAWAAILDATGVLDAVLITSDGTATARSSHDASVTNLVGDTGVSVIVSGDYSGTDITSSAGAIGFNTSGDVAIDTASGQTGISGTVGSMHAISLTSLGGNVSLTANSGDIAGKLSGTPGALPTTTSGTALSSDYGKLDVLATGTVGLTAASGALQLGTVSSGGTFTGSAKAITVDGASNGGTIDLTATAGTLYLGSGEAGLNISLTKQGAGDELRFGTLESGMLVGGSSGSTIVASSTDIRGTSITARGGSISVTAASGEVTGLSGGRLTLSALPDLDGLGDPVAGTDTGTISVTSGLLSRLGNVRAGSSIAITAGVSGSATLGGAIDVLDVTSAGGDIDLTTYNDGIATNGISYEDLSGQRIWAFAYGTASGDVSGQTANGADLYTYSESGGVTVTDHTATGYIYLIAAGGDLNADTVDAGTDVAYLFASNNAQATSVSSDAGVYLLADNDVDVGTATAGTFLFGDAGNDFKLQNGSAADYASLTAGNNMELGTISSSAGYIELNAGGDITGTSGFTANAALRPDITAATYVDITAAGSVELDTANATGGSLTVRAGTLTGDGSIDINSATSGSSMQLAATATGTADDPDHNGTVRVDTALAGTTLTLSNVLFGGTIGDVTVDTSATAGSGALGSATGNDARFDAAGDARIESATALTGTIAVRAGGAIGAANIAQGADLNAGEDLALKAGNGINLGVATAGDDLILESTDTITVGDLTATGTNALLDNRTVSFASPTTIAIAGPETNPGASIVVRSSSGSVNSTGTLTANNGSVTIDAADGATVSGDVVAGINYTVKAVNDITLGGAGSATQQAKGAVLIESASGGVSDNTGSLTLQSNSDGLGTETLTITAPLDITIASATLIGGDGGKQSDVLLTSTSGEISVTGIDAARLIASATTAFTATAAIAVGSAANPADAIAGPSTVDIKVSDGTIDAVDITAVGAGHDIRLSASGAITVGALTAARSVIVSGATTGSGSGAFVADELTSQAGSIDIKATSISVANATSSADTLTAETTGGTLALADATSGGAMSLLSSADLTANSLTSTGGGITGSAASVDISGTVNSAGPLELTATGGDLAIGGGSVSGTVSLTASEKISTGALSAGGNAITLTAADADITGTISGSTILVINNAAAGNALRIGDNAEGTGGFALDAAEVNLLSAATVTLDAGTGAGLTAQDVQIGDLDLTNATLQSLEINGLQRIDITGALTKGAGSGLTGLRLGGTATETDLATVLRLAALGDGTGGLIDVGSAALELRAAKIGAGQDAGFLDLVGIGANPVGTPLDARLMVSNPASSLYNATALGGTIYQPAAQVLIKANTMVVRYSDFALFQNTGLPGANEGVRLASAASPIAPALRIIGPANPIGGPFAMFGEINGVRDTATALLGDAVINVVSVDRTSARINGCLIGSGAGCLTTLAISPILGTFDPVRGSIFFANADFELPFDPLVGTNNDSLFGDVGTFGLEDVPLESIECADDKAGAECAKPNGEQK